MAVTVAESKKGSWSLSATEASQEYIIAGATSQTEALIALLTNPIVPNTVNGFPADRTTWGVSETGANGIYRGTAKYKQSQFEAKKNQAPNTFRFSFDISGQQTRRLYSRKNVGNYGKTGTTAPTFKQAVGVGADGTIEGADVIIPFMTWTASFRVNADQVTSSYVAGLSQTVGTINQNAWNGFLSEVLLLTGVSGDKQYYIPQDSTNGQGSWVYDLVFKFAVQWDENDIKIGDIQQFNKKGWQYLWVHFEQVKDTDAKKMVSRPLSAHLEDMYPKTDFGSRLGFGA